MSRAVRCDECGRFRPASEVHEVWGEWPNVGLDHDAGWSLWLVTPVGVASILLFLHRTAQWQKRRAAEMDLSS